MWCLIQILVCINYIPKTDAVESLMIGVTIKDGLKLCVVQIFMMISFHSLHFLIGSIINVIFLCFCISIVTLTLYSHCYNYVVYLLDKKEKNSINIIYNSCLHCIYNCIFWMKTLSLFDIWSTHNLTSISSEVAVPRLTLNQGGELKLQQAVLQFSPYHRAWL